MKLYYMPAACSLSVQITLNELGEAYEPVLVSNQKTLPDGSDYTAINPRGQVPALQFDDGSLLTEGPVIVQYLADRHPETPLMPAMGTMARYRELEWLNYLTSEIHQRFYSLFRYPQVPEDVTQIFRDDLDTRLAYVSHKLGDQTYLMGEIFTLADGYLFAMLRWTGFLKIDLKRWVNLEPYRARVAARPAVQAAMEQAGLRRK